LNPIFTWIIAHAAAQKLAWRCPRCHRRQVVAEEKAKEAVPCQRCGTMIPPKRK
jgi:ribosomal protein S27E